MALWNEFKIGKYVYMLALSRITYRSPNLDGAPAIVLSLLSLLITMSHHKTKEIIILAFSLLHVA